jgi:hypothetical protein
MPFAVIHLLLSTVFFFFATMLICHNALEPSSENKRPPDKALTFTLRPALLNRNKTKTKNKTNAARLNAK